MPDVDYTAWRFWLDIGQILWGLAVCVYVYLATRRKAMEQRFAGVETSLTRQIAALRTDIEAARKERANEIENRCGRQIERIAILERNEQTLEMKLNEMPSHRDIRQLSDNISQLNGRLEGINRAVDLINEFLINQGGRGAS